MDEILFRYRNEYLISDNMTPTRKRQAFDEILKKEKELAGMIYYQKDLEGRYL